MRNWVIVILSLLLFLSVLQVHSLQEGNQSLQGYIEHQNDSISIWKDKYHRSNAEKNILQLDRDKFKTLYVEGVAKDFDVKPKQIESIATVSTSTSTSIGVPVTTDSTGNFTFTYREKWIDVAGNYTSGILHLDIIGSDSIRLITKHRKRIFKPDLYTVHALTYNPATVFREVDHVEIKPRVKRFSVGAGVYYTPAGIQIGVGIHYNLLQF